MPMAWLRKLKDDCLVGVVIWIALDRWLGMWQSMDVVARGAGHRCAGAKALAAPQESDLIPVHVGDRRIPVRRGEKVVIELFTRLVSERGLDLFPQARMTQCAVIHLSISGEARGIDNVFPADIRRMGRLVLHMLAAVAVALFA